jgi:phage gpG-like protein
VEYFDVAVDASEIIEIIDDFQERGGNLEPVMAIIAEDLVSAVSDRYESEGDGQWPPHATSTLRKRRGGGRGAKLMQDTGVLAGSTEPNYGSDFAEATTGVEYIVYHLDGGPVIPKRNPFDLEEDVFDEAVETLLEYVVE